MIDRSLVRTLVGFLLGSGAFAGLCFGQAGRGGISGLITDATSALVPGAKVKLVNLTTGVNLEGISTSAGLYSFTALAPGNYRISVAMEGFQTVVRELIPVEADRVSGVDIELKPGAVSETVTVEGEPALMNTTNSTGDARNSVETRNPRYSTRYPVLARTASPFVTP